MLMPIWAAERAFLLKTSLFADLEICFSIEQEAREIMNAELRIMNRKHLFEKKILI